MSEGQTRSALKEVIQNWLKGCLDSAEPPAKTLEDLRTDACTFFRYISKNTQVVTDSNVILQTKSSHEDSLSKLVQDLGPAFTEEHHRSRLRALYVLTGAIDGCKDTQLSNKIDKLMGQFLLNHCGPVKDDEYTEDFDTMIRDIAIIAISSLVSIPTSSTQTDEELSETAITRMNLGESAVKRRCALPDSDETADAYGFGRPPADIRGGLSSLPRSKRAMCFDLLKKTVSVIAPIYQQTTDAFFKDDIALSTLQLQMVEFAKFTGNCLQGESDPRCLLQLLKVIGAMQVAMAPWFKAEHASIEATYPTEDIFDAVAPYFPIQFTPPPNDIHGITREGLHKALLSVLTFTDADEGVARANHQPMLTLSADLFLEILLPPPEDDNPGPLDKVEAIDCLTALLFPQSGSKAFEKMETRIAVTLSQALKVTHDESSLAASQRDQMGSESKTLADHCRRFVSRIAYELEMSSNKDLWEVFVHKTLLTLSSKIKSSPSENKTSIAYIACLASCGGVRTLRACLTLGLQPLIDFLQNQMGDDGATAAAIHGVGALCSSCQVAIARAEEHGVRLNPHPLDDYAQSLAQILLKASTEADFSDSIKIGAIRGLGCLLDVAKQDQVDDETTKNIANFVNDLVKVDSDETPDQYEHDISHQKLKFLGHFIGTVLDKESELSDSFLRGPLIDECVRQHVYPWLLPDTGSLEAKVDPRSLKILSIASSLSLEVAAPIMNSCLESLQRSIEEKGLDACHPSAEAVGFLLQNGGGMAAQAFHKCATVDKLLESMNYYAISHFKTEVELSVSTKIFPDTAEERKAFDQGLKAAKDVSNPLLPAFRHIIPKWRLVGLLNGLYEKLPPLSEADSFRICVLLPVLSEALYAPNDGPNDGDAQSEDPALEESFQKIAGYLIKGLANVLSSGEFDAGTRSAAGSCLFAVISRAKPSGACPIPEIVRQSLAQTLCAAVDLVEAENALKILSVFGSSAANRGGTSSTTADEIASFLLQTACEGKAKLPFNEQANAVFDCSVFERLCEVAFYAASAYGAMLTVPSLKPLVKQRLIHASFKFVQNAFEKERDLATSGQTIQPPGVGLLGVVCHLICDSDIGKVNRKVLHQLSTLVVEGFSSIIFEGVPGGFSSMAAKNLVLAATLKLISVAPNVVHGFSLSIVTGLLRAYAVSDPGSEVSCKLLALQGLEAVAHMEGNRASTSTMKPAVVAVLAAATSHPSGLLRQAAVDVRNAWYVLD